MTRFYSLAFAIAAAALVAGCADTPVSPTPVEGVETLSPADVTGSVEPALDPPIGASRSATYSWVSIDGLRCGRSGRYMRCSWNSLPSAWSRRVVHYEFRLTPSPSLRLSGDVHEYRVKGDGTTGAHRTAYGHNRWVKFHRLPAGSYTIRVAAKFCAKWRCGSRDSVAHSSATVEATFTVSS